MLAMTPPIEEITRTIVERFHPRRIVLFGSRARAQAGTLLSVIEAEGQTLYERA